MGTSALEWEELVLRENTVLRARVFHCPAHQEPTQTGGFTTTIYPLQHNSEHSSSGLCAMLIWFCMCVFSGSIWWTSLAVKHVHQVISVALLVLTIHLGFARQGFTVQVETLKLQVIKKWIYYWCHMIVSDIFLTFSKAAHHRSAQLFINF